MFLGFRRAIVKEFPKSSEIFKVQLVDYGTVEFISRDDIFGKVISSNIPIQASKFILLSIVPPEENPIKWSQQAVDFIYGNVVDFQANIEVKEIIGDIAFCSLDLIDNEECKNIGEELINQGMARWRKSGDVFPPKKLETIKRYEFEDHIADIKHPYVQSKLKEKELDCELNQFYSQPEVIEFSAEEIKQRLKKMKNDLNIYNDNTMKPARKTILKLAPQPAAWNLSQLELKEFRNKSKRNVRRRNVSTVQYLDLIFEEIEKFNCKYIGIDFNFVGNGIKLYLEPDIPTLNEKLIEMENILKTYDIDYLEKFSKAKDCAERLVLAQTETGWKRGKVITVDDQKQAKVFMLETAKIQNFFYDKLVRMPLKVIVIPRGTLAVILEVAANDKNFGHIKSVLPDIMLQASVQDHDDGGYPIVNFTDEFGTPINFK